MYKSYIKKTKNNQTFISQLYYFLFPYLNFKYKIPFLNISTSYKNKKNSTYNSQNSQSKKNNTNFKSIPYLQKY